MKITTCQVLQIDFAVVCFLPSLPGSLQITWQEIMVGVESGLLMFPINILIITIFRSIRPRIVLKSRNKEEGNARPARVTVPSVLRVRFCTNVSCLLYFRPKKFVHPRHYATH